MWTRESTGMDFLVESESIAIKVQDKWAQDRDRNKISDVNKAFKIDCSTQIALSSISPNTLNNIQRYYSYLNLLR